MSTLNATNLNQANNRWQNIPEELRNLNQWCVANSNKAPLYLTANDKLVNASVNKPETWMSFDMASRVAMQHNLYIGFVLTANDEYACIDLDVINEQSQQAKGQPINSSFWTKPEELERYNRLLEFFNSYSEVSISGRGAHIWIKGTLPKGCRRDGVECYSSQRFIICTGNAFLNVAIANRQEQLEQLVLEMNAHESPVDASSFKLVEVAPVESDSVIWRRACNARNNTKFKALCNGNWSELGYKSQSEADFALMSMLALYSKSDEQCRRLFRKTGLGQRSKATVNNIHLDRMLTKIRARDQMQLEHGRQIAAALLANYKQKQEQAKRLNGNEGSN